MTKPATPLPTQADRTIRGYTANFLLWPGGFESAMPTAQDAAYIVAACNAYPKLVEALTTIAQETDETDTAQTARALLRELGEAE